MASKDKVKEAAEAVIDADAAVAEKVAPVRGAFPVRVLAVASELGDQPQMRALAGAFIMAGFAFRSSRLVRTGARMLAAHELATFAKNFVKNRVDRTRPRSLGEAQDAHKLRPGDNHAKEETSFPSGHSAGAMASARAFMREFPEHRLPAYAAAGGIALAQIPRCAHYPTDVGAGLAVGAASEKAVDAGWRAAEALLARARSGD